MNNIFQRIKYYRRKSGMTQMEVAVALEVRTDNYAKYESGARIPRDDRLVKLAKILGVSYNALNEGVEREFADLLRRHAMSAVLGDADMFSAFSSDMELSAEAYYVVSEFFNKGAHHFAANNRTFYQEYLAHPNLNSLIALYELYRAQCDSEMKLAFCAAVKTYLEQNDDAMILDEAEKLAGSLLEKLDALQFFAVKVFVPYLSLIADAVGRCINTTIDDFENAFLYGALTPPEDDEEPCDESEKE